MHSLSVARQAVAYAKYDCACTAQFIAAAIRHQRARALAPPLQTMPTYALRQIVNAKANLLIYLQICPLQVIVVYLTTLLNK